MNNISLEVIEYFKINEINRENIEDLSRYLYGLGAIDYKLDNGRKIYENAISETIYPKTIGEAIEFFPKKVDLPSIE